MAEEVIATVRTAQAFGIQPVLSGMYDTTMEQALVMDSQAAAWHGGGLGVFFFIIYASYGLGVFSSLCLTCNSDPFWYPAFSFGTTLINEGHASPGQVINVFMAILVGSFALASIAPEIQGMQPQSEFGCAALSYIHIFSYYARLWSSR